MAEMFSGFPSFASLGEEDYYQLGMMMDPSMFERQLDNFMTMQLLQPAASIKWGGAQSLDNQALRTLGAMAPRGTPEPRFAPAVSPHGAQNINFNPNLQIAPPSLPGGPAGKKANMADIVYGRR